MAGSDGKSNVIFKTMPREFRDMIVFKAIQRA
jgi:hypothetical protein